MPEIVVDPARRGAADAAAERHCVPVDVHVLLTRGDQVLLLRRAETAVYAPSCVTAPGGHVEAGERLREAAVREVREEVGVDLPESALRLVHVTYHRNPHGSWRMSFVFHAAGWPGGRRPALHPEPVNAEPAKHSEMLWAPIDNLPADTVAYVRDAVTAARVGVLASEHVQHDTDPIAHDPAVPCRTLPMPVADTVFEPLRRVLGVQAPAWMGRPWTWHPGEAVPAGLPERQVLGWLFVPDGRVLLVVDADGSVTLPGGGVEPDDADAWAALVREADEEASAVVADPVWLGYQHDPDGVLYGHRPCGRPRFAARLVSLGPARPDPATGTTWRRLLASPRVAAALMGWTEALPEGLAARYAAAESLAIAPTESWEVEEVPAAGLEAGALAGEADREAQVARRPRLTACAAVLFRNAAGEVLFVRTTYREDQALLLPGGMVEATGEAPREAAAREVAEELGVQLPVGRMLATDIRAGDDQPPLQITVYDGGVLTDEQIASLRPGADGEVASVVWADPRLGVPGLPAAPGRRITAALMAAETGTGPVELVEGRVLDAPCSKAAKPPTAAVLRKRLAERLAAAGHLPDPRWHRVVERFPREQLLPGVWAPHLRPAPVGAVGPDRGVRLPGWRHVDGAGGKGRAELAWRTGSGSPLVVALAGAERVNGTRVFTGRPQTLVPGMPRQLAALHALDLRPGVTVLVLGAGAGVGAGMIHTYLHHRARPAPAVVAVEGCPHSADTARERLARAGTPLLVVAADPAAPDLAARLAARLHDTASDRVRFDRVIAKAPVDAVPAPWLRLVAAGGRLVAVLRAAGRDALLVLDHTADGFRGTLAPLPADSLDTEAPPAQPEAAGVPTGATVLRGTGIGPEVLHQPGFALALAHLTPLLSWNDTAPVQVRDGRGSRAVLQRRAGRWSVRQTGPSNPWAAAEAVHRMWEAGGCPGRYEVTAAQDGTLTVDGGPGLMWTVPPAPCDDASTDTARGGDR